MTAYDSSMTITRKTMSRITMPGMSIAVKTPWRNSKGLGYEE